jgi:hypothetical protein
MIDRAIGMAGIALAIIGIVVGTLFPQINRKLAWVCFIGGVLLLGAAVGIAFLPDGEAQSPPTVNQGPGSAYSNGQQGGVTAGTVIIGPQKRDFSDPRFAPIKQSMLAEFPKDKPIAVYSTMGDPESYSFGGEIYNFLKNAGLQMKESGVSQGVFTEPIQGISRHVKQDGSIDVLVGTR